MNDVQIRGKNIRVEAILDPGLPRILGQQQSASADLSPSHRECDRCLERSWRRSATCDRAAGGSGGGHRVFRLRPRNGSCRARLRSFLYHQTGRQGDGPRLERLVWRRARPSRPHQLPQQPDGGALFTLRFPAAAQAAAAVEAGPLNCKARWPIHLQSLCFRISALSILSSRT